MQQDIREFHEKHRYEVDQQLIRGRRSPMSELQLRNLMKHLDLLAKSLRKVGVEEAEGGDPTLYRCHLIIEELGEFLQGLVGPNPSAEDAVDGLTDLLYVVVGTFDVFGLPMQELFDEVHRSNMSKRRLDTDLRMKDKGPDYEPPKLKEILARHGRKQRRSPAAAE